MKKAKSAVEFTAKAPDLMSILGSLSNKEKKEPQENNPEKPAENKFELPPEKNPAKSVLPVLIPPFIIRNNAYNHIIEKHNKIVSKIIKNNNNNNKKV